jgi:hypothetical protein
VRGVTIGLDEVENPPDWDTGNPKESTSSLGKARAGATDESRGGGYQGDEKLFESHGF